MPHANPGIHHVKVGDAVVTALNDGQFDADLAWVTGLPANEAEGLLRETFRVLPPRITVSCFLIRVGGKNILIDGGAGGAMGHVLGHARHRLAAIGVAPDSIDTLLITHAHVDHVNGLLDESGGALYPNADLFIHQAETDFWLSEAVQAQAPESAQMYFGIAQRALAPYAARTRRIKDGDEVLPGITALHLPGLQFAQPVAGMAFDIDGEQGRATRARTLDLVATDKLLLAGMHLDFPTFGHVRRAGAGYAFEPVVWAPTDSGLFSGD